MSRRRLNQWGEDDLGGLRDTGRCGVTGEHLLQCQKTADLYNQYLQITGERPYPAYPDFKYYPDWFGLEEIPELIRLQDEMRAKLKERFEADYAARSGLSVKNLHSLGLEARPCDCGDAICQGWQMVSSEVNGG